MKETHEIVDGAWRYTVEVPGYGKAIWNDSYPGYLVQGDIPARCPICGQCLEKDDYEESLQVIEIIACEPCQIFWQVGKWGIT